ncbi:MAG: type 1 glutamine amidotransferase [Burkholderiales bacterium]
MSRPVAIFRHFATEGPAYLGDFLKQRQISWQLLALDEGAAVPLHPGDYAGLVFMGGPMSVNDPLPWIAPVLQLIRQAVDQDIPVLGHCLGSQLMSRALGGEVSRTALKEIGWGAVRVREGTVARHWFGAVEDFEAFHWHGETWSLPIDAGLIASSSACAHQAFALGPHLGLQFHVEMTEPYIRRWCMDGRREIEACNGPGVQPVATILQQMQVRLPLLHAVADTLYGVWIKALKD